MKTVKDRAELARMLVEQGATAKLGGRTLNADAITAQPQRRQPAPPVQTEQIAPKPITAAELADALAQRDHQWQQRLDAAIADVNRRADQRLLVAPAIPQDPVSAWRFDVDLDDAGQIRGLVAVPDHGQTAQGH